MADNKVKIVITEAIKKKLLGVVNELEESEEKDLLLAIVNATNEVEVDIGEEDVGPIIKGPAQHIAHQINN